MAASPRIKLAVLPIAQLRPRSRKSHWARRYQPARRTSTVRTTTGNALHCQAEIDVLVGIEDEKSAERKNTCTSFSRSDTERLVVIRACPPDRPPRLC